MNSAETAPAVKKEDKCYMPLDTFRHLVKLGLISKEHANKVVSIDNMFTSKYANGTQMLAIPADWNKEESVTV